MSRHLSVLPLAFCLLFPLPQEDTTRKLWDTAFVNQPGNRAKAKTASAKRRYRIATPAIPPTQIAGDTVIGVTLWRLRPSKSTDAGERLLVQEGAEAANWIPERIEADAKLAAGARVRISVEAARAGYLYVIDREQYADGTLGEPYLIFPTNRTNAGSNEVKPGRVVEIPDQEDQPPFFTLKPSRPDQVGELLSVLVTTTPLEGLQIGDTAQKLTAGQVAAWEKSWGGTVGRLELEDGAGKAWTKAEREAGADTTRALTRDAPAPQTLYYNPAAKSGQPVLVSVQLRYGANASARPSRR